MFGLMSTAHAAAKAAKLLLIPFVSAARHSYAVAIAPLGLPSDCTVGLPFPEWCTSYCTLWAMFRNIAVFFVSDGLFFVSDCSGLCLC